MQLPAAWQGMPGQPQIPAAAQQMAAAAQGAAMQQPGGMMAYPMQQFQVLTHDIVQRKYKADSSIPQSKMKSFPVKKDKNSMN